MKSETSGVNGAVTAAISQKGIQSFCSSGLIDFVKGQIGKSSVPDEKYGNYDIGHDKNVWIKITGGEATLQDINLDSVSQGDNGTFTIVFKATIYIVYGTWHEEFDHIEYTQGTVIKNHEKHTFTNEFYFTVDPVDLTFDVQLTLKSGKLVIVVNSCSSKVKSVDIHLPGDSVLAGHCKSVQDKIDSKIKDSISKEDFATPIKDKIQPYFDEIPDSGKLTDNIVVKFPFEGMEFENNNSIEAGTTAQVVFKGTPYPEKFSFLPYPAVVTDKDIHFFVHNYEFNGLLWAFYQEGDLHERITKDMLPDPQELTTDYYSGIPGLDWIATDFPHRDMVVYVTALESPTVAINTTGAKVTYKVNCTLKVIDNSNEILLIEAIVDQVCDLTSLALVGSGGLQRVTFKFSLDTFTAKLEKSYKPIDPALFNLIWKMIIEPEYARQMEKVGETGVALPSMTLFSFCNTAFGLLTDYLSVKTNICAP